MQIVKIVVKNGCADVVEMPEGVRVIIVDSDIPDDDMARFEYVLEDGKVVVDSFGLASESEADPSEPGHPLNPRSDYEIERDRL